MKRSPHLLPGALLAGMLFLSLAPARAEDGRPGSVEWSNGRKLAGAISLSPGKDLRLFTQGSQASLKLDEVREIRFRPEKEEMQEGFYFPDAGQATQVKTGEIYPVRQLQTKITLSDGKVLEGHLFTTTLYVETDNGTEKIVLMAKQTGANGQKMADLFYPTEIRFDAGASSGASQIDLTHSGFSDAKQIVVVARPDLGLLPASQVEGKQVWTVPMGDPTRILFSVQTADGLHVAWPDAPAAPDIQQAITASLKVMQDFYDTRTLLACFADADDVSSLVMMKRTGITNGFSADRQPWSLVILRWKYDSTGKKATLLNRAALATGRSDSNSPLPEVFKKEALLMDISTLNPPAPAGPHP